MKLLICIGVIFISMFIVVVFCIAAAPKNDYERMIDDEAQMKYLKEIREKKNKK